MLGDDAFVTGTEIGMAEQAQQFVGTVAAENVRNVQPMHIGDRLTQFLGLPVRIPLQMLGRTAEGLDGLRAGAERRLVRGKLEHARNARCMLLARHIGGDIENAGTRDGLAHFHAHGFDLGKGRKLPALDTPSH